MRDQLYHHGIKGQKWGIRRYQNEDGSLTLLGRNRRVSKMSDADLDSSIRRLQKEKQYKELAHPYRSEGKKAAAKAITAALVAIPVAYLKNDAFKEKVNKGAQFIGNAVKAVANKARQSGNTNIRDLALIKR